MSDNYIGVLVEPEMKVRLKELAEQDRRKLSDFVRNVLEDYIKGKQVS